MTTTTPASKLDVYDPYTDPATGGDVTAWSIVARRARDAGKLYARPHSPSDRNGVYTLTGAQRIAEWQDIPDTPPVAVALTETPSRDLFTAVMEYLDDPDRSERSTVFTKLASYGFFGTDSDETRLEALNNVLRYYDSTCPDGARRARESLSDVLPQPARKTIRATFEIEVEGTAAADLSGDDDHGVVYDIAHALNDQTVSVSNDGLKIVNARYTDYIVL
jgi:hypothetical protein